MISRSRSISSVAAMSIDRTTSANSTVTCLYLDASVEAINCAPHVSQNRAPSCGTAPHDRHPLVAGVTESCADREAPTECPIRQAYGGSHTRMSKVTILTCATLTCARRLEVW